MKRPAYWSAARITRNHRPARCLLTAGVDTQDDRLEIEVVAWGRYEESWQLIYTQIPGDPEKPQVWDQLDKFLLRTFETADGRTLRIRAACVDTGGHHAEHVYKFTRPRWKRRVWAIKGASRGLGVPVWPGKISRSKKHHGRLFVINVDQAKKVTVDYLKIDAPGPGYCHFPAERAHQPHYFEQFAAEELITVYDKRGFSKKVWRKRPGKRNEALDLRAYAYTALCGLYASGLELNKEADRLMQMQTAPPKPATPNLNQAPPVGGVFNSGIGPAGLSVPAADPYL